MPGFGSGPTEIEKSWYSPGLTPAAALAVQITVLTALVILVPSASTGSGSGASVVLTVQPGSGFAADVEEWSVRRKLDFELDGAGAIGLVGYPESQRTERTGSGAVGAHRYVGASRRRQQDERGSAESGGQGAPA